MEQIQKSSHHIRCARQAAQTRRIGSGILICSGERDDDEQDEERPSDCSISPPLQPLHGSFRRGTRLPQSSSANSVHVEDAPFRGRRVPWGLRQSGIRDREGWRWYGKRGNLGSRRLQERIRSLEYCQNVILDPLVDLNTRSDVQNLGYSKKGPSMLEQY